MQPIINLHKENQVNKFLVLFPKLINQVNPQGHYLRKKTIHLNFYNIRYLHKLVSNSLVISCLQIIVPFLIHFFYYIMLDTHKYHSILNVSNRVLHHHRRSNLQISNLDAHLNKWKKHTSKIKQLKLWIDYLHWFQHHVVK